MRNPRTQPLMAGMNRSVEEMCNVVWLRQALAEYQDRLNIVVDNRQGQFEKETKETLHDCLYWLLA